MQDSASVITQATKGLAEDLARVYDLSLSRIYELLSKDNPFPKSKRLIRKIGRLDTSADKWRVRLIKADLDAMFEELLSDADQSEVTCAELHAELSDAIQAKIADRPRPECLKEFREARALLDREIERLERNGIQGDYFNDMARAS